MKSSRRIVQKSSEALRGLQPGAGPAVRYPSDTPSTVPGVFRTSILPFETSFSAAC